MNILKEDINQEVEEKLALLKGASKQSSIFTAELDAKQNEIIKEATTKTGSKAKWRAHTGLLGGAAGSMIGGLSSDEGNELSGALAGGLLGSGIGGGLGVGAGKILPSLANLRTRSLTNKFDDLVNRTSKYLEKDRFSNLVKDFQKNSPVDLGDGFHDHIMSDVTKKIRRFQLGAKNRLRNYNLDDLDDYADPTETMSRLFGNKLRGGHTLPSFIREELGEGSQALNEYLQKKLREYK